MAEQSSKQLLKKICSRLHEMGEDSLRTGKTLVTESMVLNQRLNEGMTEEKMLECLEIFRKKCPFLFENN